MSFKVLTFFTVGIIFFFNLQARVFAEKDKLKFCLVDTKYTNRLIYSTCPNLKNEVECVVASDRVSCLKLLINDQVDFMTVEPEDLRVLGMTEAYDNKVLVTHELRIWENARSRFQLVTVIRQSVHDVWHTMKKRFCSPGLEPSLFVLDYLKYFENQLVFPDCSPTKSLLENRLSALSQYFESACIGGPWTSDQHLDNQLKRKYNNLCSQCGSPSCSVENKYFGREGVLLCLTEGGGEIAWARLDFVRQHFMELKDDENDYYFLCADGTTKNLTEPDPCVWFEEPWRTTIARKAIAEEVKKFINYETNTVDDSLSILQEDIRRIPVSVENFKTPSDYLKISFPKFYSFKDHLQCQPNNREVKWCVTSDLEVQKCEWISKAANSYGVEPLIECIQETSRENCIKSVIDIKTDIFPIKPLEDLEARKKGLKPIVHMVSNTDAHEKEIAALVTKFSNFNSLQDLKNHKACFLRFRDAGWNYFVYMMKNLTKDNDWLCKDKEMVSQFFSESCVADLSIKNTSFPKNLYSFCSHTAVKNVDKVALDCLHNGGDVAFVNLSSIMYYYPGSLENNYRQLCINGSKSDSGKTEKCQLSWKTQGSLMVHGKISKMREDEIYLMLVDLDRLFGQHYQDLSPLVSLYGPFDGENNVIFPEHTECFERDVDDLRTSLSYHEILEDVMTHRQKCSKANSPRQEVYLIILVPLIYLWTTSF